MFPPGKNNHEQLRWCFWVLLLSILKCSHFLLSISGLSGEGIVCLPREGFREHDLITGEHFIFFLLQAMGN